MSLETLQVGDLHTINNKIYKLVGLEINLDDMDLTIIYRFASLDSGITLTKEDLLDE